MSQRERPRWLDFSSKIHSQNSRNLTHNLPCSREPMDRRIRRATVVVGFVVAQKFGFGQKLWACCEPTGVEFPQAALKMSVRFTDSHLAKFLDAGRVDLGSLTSQNCQLVDCHHELEEPSQSPRLSSCGSQLDRKVPLQFAETSFFLNRKEIALGAERLRYLDRTRAVESSTSATTFFDQLERV